MDYDISNFLFSLSLFLIGIGLFIYFKYRVQRLENNETPNIGYQSNSPNNNLYVKRILNPFFIEFDFKKSSLDDGIFFKVKSNVQFKSSFNCLVVWSTSIDEFYKELEKNVNTIFDEDYLSGISAKRTKIEIIQEEDSETPIENDYFYKTPEICKLTHEKQYNNITKTYPIVIILYRQQSDLERLCETDIVATYHIVHLKDKNMDTKLLYYYKKLLNNKIINMNRLYAEESDKCVVCLTAKSDQVLLPCKHICTCSECLPHLNNKCPLCRGPIYRSFKAQ